MQAEVNGKVIQLSEAGWLENLDEWSEDLAHEIAKNEKEMHLFRLFCQFFRLKITEIFPH